MAVALNVLANVLWEQAIIVVVLPEDSLIQAATQALRFVAIVCSLMFAAMMITPEVGRVSLPFHLNWSLSAVNGTAWAVACVLLNLSMLTERFMAKRSEWPFFISCEMIAHAHRADRTRTQR